MILIFKKVPVFCLLMLIVFQSCKIKPAANQIDKIETIANNINFQEEIPAIEFNTFERTEIKNRLSEKIASKEDLVVHLFVPLCDNEHQGIVPVNATLGDGFNPKSNLYWGAMYGIKSYFKRNAKWKMLSSSNISDTILERVVFVWERSNASDVYVIADAYRGDKMKECLDDFYNALAISKESTIDVNGKNIKIGSNADLVGFNGHNGMMDVEIEYKKNKNVPAKDAIVIACASHGFFTPNLQVSGGYPLLTTTNLLAPEAYVVEAVISAWAENKNGDEIVHAAGVAYNEYQKCGLNGAKRLFKTGW